MSLTVVVLRQARLDAEYILHWIAERSPQGAAQWGRAYDQAVMGLGRDGGQHGLAAEDSRLQIGLREKLFKTRRGRPYRLLYIVVGTEAKVLRVRGAGQAPVSADDLDERR